MLFNKSDNDEPRFAFVKTEGDVTKGEFRIVVDRKTGIHYLWVKHGPAGGLTPLLDKNGNPIGSQK